jgi:hypothetical protein
VTFWNWRRGTQTASSGTAALSLAPDLAPIELYTADARIVGWVAAGGLRVTDLLNNHDELRLWRPAPGPIDATDVPDDRLPHPGDQNGEWQSLSAAAVLLAMPPEWRSSRQLRLHRRLRRVAISIGPFNVTGNLHLHPGVEPGPHLLARGPSFMPLTDAYLLHDGEPPFEHVVSVVILNTRHVTSLVSLITLA